MSKPIVGLIYVDGTGRRRSGAYKVCETCKQKFLTRKQWINRAKYCSVACRNKGKQKQILKTCAWCGKAISRKLSALCNSKSGLFFCNRKCKEDAQRLGGLSEIQPSHYGNSKNNAEAYKTNVERTSNAVCCDCGEDRRYLLLTHHIDGDRDHNEPNNWEIVCYNCHARRHLYKNKEGIWTYWTHALTPREELVNV